MYGVKEDKLSVVHLPYFLEFSLPLNRSCIACVHNNWMGVAKGAVVESLE